MHKLPQSFFVALVSLDPMSVGLIRSSATLDVAIIIDLTNGAYT